MLVLLCNLAVEDNMYAFYCNICNKSVSCEHMGEADVSRHVDSEMHRKTYEEGGRALI